MSPDTFHRQIEAARRRLEALEARAGGSVEGGALISETLQELSTALEELHVAAEEMRHQNEELASSHEVIEAERQRYQDLFEFAPDGYLVTDLEGTIREANRAAATLLGVRQDFLAGKPLLVFVAAEAHQDFHGRLTQMPERIRVSEDWEIQLQPREGLPFPAALTVGLARDAADQPTGLRWLVRDITERKGVEREREKLVQALQESLAKVRTLSGLLPICAWCKKIRDDEGYWTQVEMYIEKHSAAHFSHGICPECMAKHRSEFTSGKDSQHGMQGPPREDTVG